MSALKTAASLLARFSLCFALIACLWIVSISYRVGSFDYRDGWIVAHNSGGYADSDGVVLAAALALLIGLSGLYRSGRISAVLMVIASLVIITTIDHVWATLSGDPTIHKAVPGHVIPPAIAAALICPLTWLFPAGREASGKRLAGCWAALAITVGLLGGHGISYGIFHLNSVIGPTYMMAVFFCLLVPEILRQAWRFRRTLSLRGEPAA